MLAAASPLMDADAHSTTRARPSTTVARASATVVAPHDPAAPTTGTTNSPDAGVHRSAGFGIPTVASGGVTEATACGRAGWRKAPS